MSERKLRRLDLIRERHRKLIVKPREAVEVTFDDSWDDEPDMWEDHMIPQLVADDMEDEE